MGNLINKWVVAGTLALGSLFAARKQRLRTSRPGFRSIAMEPTAAGEWSFWVDHPGIRRPGTLQQASRSTTRTIRSSLDGPMRKGSFQSRRCR